MNNIFPKLSLDLFTEAWEYSLLIDKCKITRGGSLSKSDLNDEGEYPAILYGQLYTKYGEVARNIVSKTNAVEKGRRGNKGDILMPTSGETKEAIAKATVVNQDNILYGGDLLVCSPTAGLDPIFLAYFMNSPAAKAHVSRLAQGNTVVHTSVKSWATLVIPIPPLPEQKKIADFLSLLDERISKQEEKIVLLKEQKKGYSSKIFAQELRFTDDNGEQYPEWKEVSLGSITTPHSSNLSLGRLSQSEEDGSYPIYSATGIAGFTQSRKVITAPYITVIKDGAGVGRVAKCKPNTYFIGTLQGITASEDVNVDYLFYLCVNLRLGNLFSGSTIPHIYYKDYSQQKVLLPSLAEQEKIANFLSVFDDKISLEEEKLALLKEQKQGYMQKLFP